jgi:hypothetical protein
VTLRLTAVTVRQYDPPEFKLAITAVTVELPTPVKVTSFVVMLFTATA